ncbi:nucleoprotein [Keuraliba virus]|uniref:Nucleoprotein n=1 Tax=Keuraliba virus TaxID=380440 RepID=A0A0D3R1N3_9RHAB|nr:nucleoprotein [Keuraliba virus]AJR28568.1 nucleoprotein [Keuraliba virus]
MATTTIYRYSTKKAVQPILPSETNEVKYPKEFFKEPKKPRLTIYYKKADLPKMRAYVRQGLVEYKLDIKIVNSYLYYVLENLPAHQLTSDWTSFGIQLGNARDEIKHFVMFDVDLKGESFPNEAVAADDAAKDDKALVFLLLFQYRVSRASHDGYKTDLCDKAIKTLNAMSLNSPALTKGLISVTAAWPSNIDYTKIVAGVDMFYFKNKEATWADLRFCTLGSRYKDCAALTALSHVTQLTGVKLCQLLLWVFTERMADEADRLSEPGNEVDKADSYMPYMRDMGISDKSPYSAQVNPSLTTFCHVVGCLSDSTRSKNSRLAGEVDRSNSVINGVIVGYVFGTRPVFVQAYGADSSSEQVVVEPNTVIGAMPKNADPDEWFAFLSTDGFILPDEIRAWFEKKVKNLKDTRAGTIGSFLAEKRTI